MSHAAKLKSALKGTTDMRAADVAPVMAARATHGIVRESPVDILYMTAPDGSRLIRVKVWSKLKPGLFRFTDIQVQGNSQAAMKRKCGTAAGAITEQLIAIYGDVLEPGFCARMAEQHFDELCKHMAGKPQVTHADLAAAARKADEVSIAPEAVLQHAETE